MSATSRRDSIWSQFDQGYDILIIGGGITGAGILREAVRNGLRALLIEAGDFASGTSSRSSKLVHGGLRYLQNGQFNLVVESVRERERLLREGRGLVSPLGILLVDYRGDAIPAWAFKLGLIFYDLLALKWGHRHYDAYDIHDLCPSINEQGLLGGFRYFDAQTDDARLVLRLIQESEMDGALVLNYARAVGLLRQKDGRVCGAVIEDQAPGSLGRTIEVRARAIVNATGAWADDLRSQVGGRARLRKLRGSHLILPHVRLPLTRSVSFLHPRDGRPVFAFPWEGITLVGTTDVEMDRPLTSDPSASAAEVEYLLKAVQYAFVQQELDLSDVQATLAGVRPVINTGKANPSKESREHVLWSENGLLTVAGGKLTTFRLMALDALRKLRPLLPDTSGFLADQRALSDPRPASEQLPDSLPPALRLRLLGRHGLNTARLIQVAQLHELETVKSSLNLWAELRWAARNEMVVHLDDLLLRRLRLGLTLPHGGLDCLDEIRLVAQPELGWDDQRWENETMRYEKLWRNSYSLP